MVQLIISVLLMPFRQDYKKNKIIVAMFKIGDSVKVKQGVVVDDTDVSGWEGRIGDIPNSETNQCFVIILKLW